MSLPAAERQRVQRETKVRRNAGARRHRLSHARALEWCEAMGATVERGPAPGGLLFTVRVPGFHPASALTLAHAVAALEDNVAHFCDSVAAHGPTGARLDRLRAARRPPEVG